MDRMGEWTAQDGAGKGFTLRFRRLGERPP